MLTVALTFPMIEEVALKIGPLEIRWYALAYVAGLLLGWLYIHYLSRKGIASLTKRQVDDLLVFSTLAIILGGRLGYVFFYEPSKYFSDPIQILMIWNGGMSFHGGLVGMILGLILFSRKKNLPLLKLTDVVSMAAPIGLFFGRIANFINGELFGRPSEVPWAIVFPGGGGFPRHPSQLYEALLEGLVLFILLSFLTFFFKLNKFPGLITGIFLIGYSISRIIVELFREPDASLGFIFSSITMGQLLSLPMLLFGLILVIKPLLNGRSN